MLHEWGFLKEGGGGGGITIWTYLPDILDAFLEMAVHCFVDNIAFII